MRLRLLPVFCLFFLLPAAVQAGTQWILNRGQAEVPVIVGQGNLQQNLGLTQILPSGTDLTVTIPMKPEDAFSAEEKPFFAMRYRMKTGQKIGGIFFTTDSLKSLSDQSYSPFPIVGDGQWRHVTLDLRTCKHENWKGTVTSFRLDPTNPSDLNSEIEISRLGFFPTAEAAEAFLSAANDEPDYAMETVLRGDHFVCVIPGGTLSDGWKKEDFLLQRPETLEKGKVFTVCRDGMPVPCHVNRRGFAFYLAEKAGKYTLDDAAKFPNQNSVPFPKELAQRFGCDVSSPFPPEYFTRERIRLGGWGLARIKTWEDRFIQDFADCGLDLLIATGNESSNVNRLNLLQACDRLGVEVYLNDGGWNHPETAGEEYFDHPSFCGHYLTDEPGTDDYGKWAEAAKAYADATGKIPYINLLPMYANAAQLKFGAGAAAIEYYDSDPDLYRKYCEKYCDQVPTDYICTDIYPLNWRKDGTRHTYPEYIESINIIASVARERNKEFWCCIQTFGWVPSKRTPNAAEYRWQCWSMLSFGCRGILCWVYGAYKPDFPSLVTIENEKTPAWYDARTVFREIRKVSDVYCQFKNLGAFTHNASDEVPYLKMSGELKEFPTIQEINCPDPLLIGCFAKKDESGETAFTLVNMTELEAAKTTVAKLKLSGKTVTCYRRGEPEEVERDADGLYIFPLETGEGVFVTVK